LPAKKRVDNFSGTDAMVRGDRPCAVEDKLSTMQTALFAGGLGFRIITLSNDKLKSGLVYHDVQPGLWDVAAAYVFASLHGIEIRDGFGNPLDFTKGPKIPAATPGGRGAIAVRGDAFGYGEAGTGAAGALSIDERLKQRLLDDDLRLGKAAEKVARSMAALPSLPMVDALMNINAALKLDKDKAALADKPEFVFLTESPQTIVNLHNEMEKRKGRKNVRYIFLRKDGFTLPEYYVQQIMKDCPDIRLVLESELTAHIAAGKTVENALITLVKDRTGLDAMIEDMCLINAPEEMHRVSVVCPELLQITPRVSKREDIYSVGGLLDLAELGIAARRLAGAGFDTMTFAQLADLLDAGTKTQFLSALAELGIDAGKNVAAVVRSPVPVKDVKKDLMDAIDAQLAVMTAA